MRRTYLNQIDLPLSIGRPVSASLLWLGGV